MLFRSNCSYNPKSVLKSLFKVRTHSAMSQIVTNTTLLLLCHCGPGGGAGEAETGGLAVGRLEGQPQMQQQIHQRVPGLGVEQGSANPRGLPPQPPGCEGKWGGAAAGEEKVG